MLLRKILFLALFSISAPALADAVDVNFRDNSAQFQYIASMGSDTLGKADMHAGVLFVDKRNLLFDLGITVKDEVGSNAPGVTVGVGIKGTTGKAQNYDAAALAIGGFVRYAPFSDSRFGISGQFYLSPNILTFGEADRYIETGVKLDYEIIPQASAYLGYRRVNFGLENRPDVRLEEGVHVGVKIMF